YLRAWAIRLSLDTHSVPDLVVSRFAQMAKSDQSPVVRLALASALQRLPVSQRWSIVEGLINHSEDASDANLPLMIWFGMEPLAPADPQRAATLLAHAKIPQVRQYLARQMATLNE